MKDPAVDESHPLWALPKRIREARDFLGLTREQIGEAVGVSVSAWQNYEIGASFPKAHTFSYLVEAGISAHWLLTGEGEMLRAGKDADMRVADDGRYVMIRRADVQASAGEGTIIYSEDELEEVPFRRDQIRRFRTNPENLTVIEVRGESMMPMLLPGDEVMIDLTAGQTYVDGIYAVRVRDTLMVKRVQQLPDGRLLITSENPAYQSYEINLEEDLGDFSIVGRVLWAGRRF